MEFIIEVEDKVMLLRMVYWERLVFRGDYVIDFYNRVNSVGWFEGRGNMNIIFKGLGCFLNFKG